MDRKEAAEVLSGQIDLYRNRSYEDLCRRIGEVDAFEVTAAGGNEYQLEIEVMWDGKRAGDVRVLASIDDGGWSAFSPLSLDFVMSAECRIL